MGGIWYPGSRFGCIALLFWTSYQIDRKQGFSSFSEVKVISCVLPYLVVPGRPFHSIDTEINPGVLDSESLQVRIVVLLEQWRRQSLAFVVMPTLRSVWANGDETFWVREQVEGTCP